MPKVIGRLLKSLAADDPKAIYDLAQRELPEGAIIEPLVQEVSADGAEWADVFESKARHAGHMRAQAFEDSLRAGALDVCGRLGVVLEGSPDEVS